MDISRIFIRFTETKIGQDVLFYMLDGIYRKTYLDLDSFLYHQKPLNKEVC